MPTPVRKTCYAPAEWDAKKPLIKQLYLSERYSLAAVAHRLHREGFYINERMLKTRVRKWQLDKKLKFPDMRTAIQLVAAQGDERSGSEPRFLIRGRIVRYSEVLRYFVRKGIPDPLNWLKSLQDDGFVPSSNVELIASQETDDTPETSDEQRGLSTRWPSEGLTLSDAEKVQDLEELPMEHARQLARLRNDANNLAAMDISLTMQPYTFVGTEKLVYMTNGYCAMYLTSSRSLGHTEPTVHHLTTHAIFAQRMQDGVALLGRNQIVPAFNEFNHAFTLLKDLLVDHHPMSIALILSVVCELDSKNLNQLIMQLLRHIEKMCNIELGPFDPLTVLFRALTRVDGDTTNLALLIVRRAVDQLSEFGGTSDWKSLYLRERLCDCLYYARYDYERAAKRQALLKDQESVYGIEARNVLWTLTNIADDYLQLGNCEEAKTFYETALRRSQVLSGYGKAKSQFAALEGLAQCAMADARRLHAARNSISGESTEWRSKTDTALRLFKEAEVEARVWFPPSSRRIARVQVEILKAEALKASFNEF